MSGTICFISDFGLDDAWVGVCHAVMRRHCPGVDIVDLSHQIPAFDIRKGAAVAAAGVTQVPWATHLVVVDPGVGGSRRDLILVTKNGTVLVGPDNGVLIPASRRCGGVEGCWAIDPARATAEGPLPTFHARDVLAPAAAAVACGADPASLGSQVDSGSLSAAPFDEPQVDVGGAVAEIVDIDRFGSARISLTPQDLMRFGDGANALELSFGHVALSVPLARTFSDVQVGEPLALWDSSGWLTLAIRKGSAAERFGLVPGTVVRVARID